MPGWVWGDAQDGLSCLLCKVCALCLFRGLNGILVRSRHGRDEFDLYMQIALHLV